MITKDDPGPFGLHTIFDADGTPIAVLVGLLHTDDATDTLEPGGTLRFLISQCNTTCTEARLEDLTQLPDLGSLNGPPLSEIEDRFRLLSVENACKTSGLDPELTRTLPATALWLRLCRKAWPTRWTMDEAVMMLAQHYSHEIIGLETPEEQLATLERLPPEELRVSIRRLVRMMMGDGTISLTFRRRVMRLYREGRLDELLVPDELRSLMPMTAKVLLDERDRRWAATLSGLLPGRRSFIAVGVAHVPGLVRELRGYGFTVEPLHEPDALRLHDPRHPHAASCWPARVEQQASEMLGGQAAVSAICTPGAQDTRPLVFLAKGNLARKQLRGVPAPTLFWFPADDASTPLEFEDSFTSIRIVERRELHIGGHTVRLTRLLCADKPGSKAVLGGHEVIVAQTAATGWHLLRAVVEDGWRPSLVVDMQYDGAPSSLVNPHERWAREIVDAVADEGHDLHVITDRTRHLPPRTHRALRRQGAAVSVHQLGRLSRRWGRHGRVLRGATIFHVSRRYRHLEAVPTDSEEWHSVRAPGATP